MKIELTDKITQYSVKAIGASKREGAINRGFDLTVLIAEDLSTNTHKYVYGPRSNGKQYASNSFRSGKKKIKENKKGKYVEFSNEPMFKKVRIYI